MGDRCDDIADEWLLAIEDAGLDSADCDLSVVGDMGQERVFFLEPETPVVSNAEHPLTAEQVDHLNAVRYTRRFRMLLAADVDSRAVRLAMLRDVLETARQYQASRIAYHSGIWLSDALLRVYGGRGAGSASTMKLHPMWADGFAAGAALARRHASDNIDDQLLWGPYGTWVRVTWKAEDPSTLPERMLIWAALHRDAVEAEAADRGGFEALFTSHYPDLVDDWQILIADRRLRLLSHAARVSIPSPELLAASSAYAAAVWDRTLDLLDRGMRHGRGLLKS